MVKKLYEGRFNTCATAVLALSLPTSHLAFLESIGLIIFILPVPCCEGASLSGDAQGVYLTHLDSCIYMMSTAAQAHAHTLKWLW